MPRLQFQMILKLCKKASLKLWNRRQISFKKRKAIAKIVRAPEIQAWWRARVRSKKRAVIERGEAYAVTRFASLQCSGALMCDFAVTTLPLQHNN